MRGGPVANAYNLLESLDLGSDLTGPNAAGGIDFFTESNMVSQWLSARPRDQVTLSLLQQRMNDLGTGIRVVAGITA
jgi:hypothetical protein